MGMWRPRSSRTGRLLEGQVVVGREGTEVEAFCLQGVGSGVKDVHSLRRAEVLKRYLMAVT